MNRLSLEYKPKGLVIFGAPCNQFGHQENGDGEEILNILKHVRPGNGFVPQFQLLEKGDVNGYNTQPLYRFLRFKLPIAADRNVDEELGIDKPKDHTWNVLYSPISPTDIKWNFEKFIIDRNGEPRYRFSPSKPTEDLKDTIEALLKE